MIVVDTSVWIDFFADRSTAQVEYLSDRLDDGTQELALTDIILTEILQGLGTDSEVRTVDDHLSAMEILRLRELANFRRAAALYRTARRAGVTVLRTSDCLIAAVCVREQAAILHQDRDFDHQARVTDLAVVHVDANHSVADRTALWQ